MNKSFGKFSCSMFSLTIAVAFITGFFLSPPSVFSDKPDNGQITFLTSQELDWINKNNGRIRMAPDPYFPPLEFFNEKGELDGIAPDYIKLIEKKTGLRFQIVRLANFEEILEKAKQREIDLVCTVIKTPERSDYLLFTSPYISIPNAIVARNDVGKKLDVDDLKNMTDIVYQGGYAIGSFLAKKHGITHLEPVTSPEEALKKLSMGKINAMVGNLATISYYSRKMNLANLKVAGDCGFDDTLAFASRKDLPILNSILEKTLREISEEERDTVWDDWIKIESTVFYEDTDFWISAILVLGVLSFIIMLLFVWNRTLKRLISLKTLELQKSEEKYRSLVENSTEAIFVVQDGFFVFSNPAAVNLAGFTHEELFKKTYIELVHVDDMEIVSENIKMRLDGDFSFFRFLIRIVIKGGATRWVEANSVLIDWEAMPAVLIFVTDVTERKWAEDEKHKLEEHLVQAQKMEAIGRLAGGVAHDFNNMLTAIMGHTELAMLKAGLSDSLHDDLTEIKNAAERSAALTSQLLSFARKQTAVPKVINLNNTVEAMLKILVRLIGENIELVWRPYPALDNIKIDPGQVDQILTNLLVNARDAIAGESGKISIETMNVVFDEMYCAEYLDVFPGEYVMLSVCDNGCGMDKETRANIFEPFFTTKDYGKGTGLGLATVYGIVRQNNGFINVYSEPGAGTSFRIYLRKYLEADIEPRSELTVINTITGSETILVVEDEKIILELGRSILERFGYNVLPASNPVEAMRIAESHAGKIHLLVTDIVMPGMNGLDLSERLVSINPDIKTVFMSGYTADIISHNGILETGVNIIQKPFTVKELALTVRKVLDS